MNRANIRSYLMLMGGAAVSLGPGTGGECDPYTKPANTSVNQDLSESLVRIDNSSVNVNICENMT